MVACQEGVLADAFGCARGGAASTRLAFKAWGKKHEPLRQAGNLFRNLVPVLRQVHIDGYRPVVIVQEVGAQR